MNQNRSNGPPPPSGMNQYPPPHCGPGPGNGPMPSRGGPPGPGGGTMPPPRGAPPPSQQQQQPAQGAAGSSAPDANGNGPVRPPNMSGALRGRGWRGPPLSAPHPAVVNRATQGPPTPGGGVASNPTTPMSTASECAATRAAASGSASNVSAPPGINSKAPTLSSQKCASSTPSSAASTPSVAVTANATQVPSNTSKNQPPPGTPGISTTATTPSHSTSATPTTRSNTANATATPVAAPTRQQLQQQHSSASRLASAMISAPPRPFRLSRPSVNAGATSGSTQGGGAFGAYPPPTQMLPVRAL